MAASSPKMMQCILGMDWLSLLARVEVKIGSHAGEDWRKRVASSQLRVMQKSTDSLHLGFRLLFLPWAFAQPQAWQNSYRDILKEGWWMLTAELLGRRLLLEEAPASPRAPRKAETKGSVGA